MVLDARLYGCTKPSRGEFISVKLNRLYFRPTCRLIARLIDFAGFHGTFRVEKKGVPFRTLECG